MQSLKPQSAARAVSPVRVVLASFAAGVSAMVVAGLFGPILLKGGLSLPDADASTMITRAPVIEPLDVAAVEAQLQHAEQSMAAVRERTESAIVRLDRLDGV